MARTTASRRNTNTVTINFEGVEGRRPLVDPGDYACKVLEVERVVQRGKDDYLKWTFEILDGEFEGSKLYTNTSLSENALWNLRGLLEALGEEVPDSEMEIDLTDMADKEIMIAVDHEDYEGRPRARVVDYAAMEVEDEKPARGGKKPGRKRPAKNEPEPVEADSVNDMSQEELEALADEYELDVDFKALKVLRKMKAAVIEALEEAGALASEEAENEPAEEDEKPARTARRGGRRR